MEPADVQGDGADCQGQGVPILVDAAAEILTIPNVHLQKGATLVAYSGGKCLRGPQTAGLLLGRKDLVKAAWVHSAPHHGPSRLQGRQGRSDRACWRPSRRGSSATTTPSGSDGPAGSSTSRRR